MLANQWTIEIIVINAVLTITSAVIGYLVAALWHGRQVSMLPAQLEQAQQVQASASEQQTALHGQLKVAEAQCHTRPSIIRIRVDCPALISKILNKRSTSHAHW